MKPRTKIQIAVDFLQNRLLTITEEQKQYAFEGLFKKYCYRSKNKAFCLECGNDIDVNLLGKKKSIICPNCEAKLNIEASNKRTLNTRYQIFGFTEIVKYDNYNFQVVRIFELAKYCKKGEKPRFYFNEICQNWYEEKGKKVIYARLETPYCFSGNLEIRQETYWKKYEPYIQLYCKNSKFKDEYVKYGITHKIVGSLETTYLTARRMPQAETLLKANYHNVFQRFQDNEIREFWKALKICIRHKYKIKEADIYRDYLQLVKELGKDLSNPIIVCPKNLYKEHDKVLKIVQRKRDKEEAKSIKQKAIQQALEDAEALKKFKEEKEKFFNLEIKGKGIKIVPLKSIEDFAKEAEIHKHCILSNKYYNKENSLILKAEINGLSVETIELDLNKMQIVQSRGLHNKSSKHHDEIINLLNSNKHRIEKIHYQV